jgi:hypothetical protein
MGELGHFLMEKAVAFFVVLTILWIFKALACVWQLATPQAHSVINSGTAVPWTEAFEIIRHGLPAVRLSRLGNVKILRHS